MATNFVFKGRCHGNQFCGKIVAKLPPPALIDLAFQIRMEDHNFLEE